MNQNFHQPFGEVRNLFRHRSVLSYLIFINILVWLIIQLFRVMAFLFDRPESASVFSGIIDYLAVPASVPLLLHQPWSIITYMFLHVNIWHILFNLLWLFWFGRIFLEYLTEKQLLWIYLLGGIAGALVYILAFNLFPVFIPTLELSYALGASASVMAIVAAVAFYVPNYTLYLLFFGRVRIIYLAIALFVFDFFMIPSGNAGGHIAHIGGALFGFAYVKLGCPSRSSGTSGQSRSPAWFTSLFRSRKRKFSGNRYTYKRPVTDEDYNYQKAQQQKRIDAILDKISKGGYDSLTREEKEFLFKSSGKQ